MYSLNTLLPNVTYNLWMKFTNGKNVNAFSSFCFWEKHVEVRESKSVKKKTARPSKTLERGQNKWRGCSVKAQYKH